MSRKSEANATRGQILETSLGLEKGAASLYRSFARRTARPRLCALWERMAAEEDRHAAVVASLAERENLALPVVPAGELSRVESHVAELFRAAEPPDLDDVGMVSIAAAIEMSEMDEIFGALCRAAGVDPDRGRAAHISDLTEAAIALGDTGTAMRHLLAAFIRLERHGRGGAAWPQAREQPAMTAS